MFVEVNYNDRFHELRQNDLERAWRRRELVRRARASHAASHMRLLAALRSMRRRTPAAGVGAPCTVSTERTIPWSA